MICRPRASSFRESTLSNCENSNVLANKDSRKIKNLLPIFAHRISPWTRKRRRFGEKQAGSSVISRNHSHNSLFSIVSSLLPATRSYNCFKSKKTSCCSKRLYLSKNLVNKVKIIKKNKWSRYNRSWNYNFRKSGSLENSLNLRNKKASQFSYSPLIHSPLSLTLTMLMLSKQVLMLFHLFLKSF